MKKIFRIGKYILILPALILLYLASAFLFSSIPYNTLFVQSTNDPVTIFLHTNGVHTDILVPAAHSFQDWDTLLSYVPAATAYIAFGWGDKGFYLNTPTWGDLTFSTAFKAASGLSTTAMHVSYFKNTPVISEQTVQIDITKEQYAVLCGYIQHSFKKDSSNHIITVPHDSRYYSGNFYDANGAYSIFKSCNTWVNIGLKKSDIRTCLWTPFDWPLLNVYK